VEPDFSGIQQEISKTEKSLKGFESRINSTFKGISEGLGINLGKLTKVGLIAAATKKLVDFGKASIEVASDLREVQNVVDVTFGHMAKEVDEFAANAREQFGLSELSAKKFASTMGAMLKSSGITGEAVKDMSIELTKLAADMASFYNLDPEVAFTKIRAGISGETEPLKQLGINMNIANLEAFALSQGINKAWKEMTQAEQTMLRYNYLLAVTGDAQGDFARTSESWANQVKILKEQWQEFMSLIGKALIEVLLPVVKFLNRALEILIEITKAIGKIYTMITGREIGVESSIENTGDLADNYDDLTDAAIDAGKGQNKLADGIGKAAKAAKKALAPFDELNILQQNLASGGSGGSGGTSGGLGNLFTPVKSEINTKIDTRQVDDGIEEAKRKWEGFFIWLDDWWNRIKELVTVPIYVPAPVFAPIPDPIYEPNWGLNPPPIPAVNYSKYINSLQIMQLQTSNIFNTIKVNVANQLTALQREMSKVWENIRRDTEIATGRIMEGFKRAWGTIESNFRTFRTNVGIIAAGVATTLISNINRGLTTVGKNVNTTIITVQNNLQTFGRNVGAVIAETARTFAGNFSESFRVTARNFVTFANSVGQNLRAFGSGFLRAAAETARGFVNNMVSGFSTVWNNFKNLMSSLGERVSGWFRENKSMVIKTTIAAGIIIGGAALALTAPQAIPYVAKGLAGLAAIPALAKGGITNGPTLALVGDNPGGREVVSPLDDLLGMIEKTVNKAIRNNATTSDRPIEVNLIVDGNKLGRVVINSINSLQKQEGRILLDL
jgi:hypothetical protein